MSAVYVVHIVCKAECNPTVEAILGLPTCSYLTSHCGIGIQG